ncbi:hypothetical protein [Formosa sp. A9]|uniref:hypothetical protein n=1 Tax=Formosa sp. A9 TaxID=3442641 RepID=UPI003EB817A4
MKKITILIYILGLTLNAQNSNLIEKQKTTINPKDQIEINIAIGSKNQDLQNYFDFEKIGLFNFTINGNSVKDKAFILKLKEFENGNLKDVYTLFDESKNKYFRTDSTSMSLKIFTKIDQENLKIWIRGKSFGSKHSYFKLQEKNKSRYIVKDFIGGRNPLIKDVLKPFYLLAVITPYITESGAGQYCKVAYSDIEPEQFGKEFNIPHYFLVEMEFIE